MSNICLLFKEFMPLSSDDRTNRQIERIDKTILKINDDIFEKRKKLRQMKENIKILADPKNKMEGKNSSRGRLILSYKN